MSEHTAGPWRRTPRPNDSGLIVANDETRPSGYCSVASVHFQEDGSTEANARLIAAAPELLEALYEAAEALQVVVHSKSSLDPQAAMATMRRIDAAIVKAASD